ncbi:endonuclease/exonuclease/phosphatase family protein [Rhodoferax sp.]|uniref:endonuclease/exonuclease/phosphatase family protein n=1 Tax=Rhodoferax sp. TaxID=50421 RepID=UPI002632A13E|nr:endonuclease/exonuclease/phosphatase family protein [Rhodoferax sp.]MDD2920227.1 endonuclease/exonuclease/phosphatase family protein [Rhodoferax sp.]
MRTFHFALLMLITALITACALTPASTQEVLHVMSYNIRCGFCERADDVNHWSRRKFLVADVIKKSQADVIGLQEAEAFQVKDLAALLGDFDWVGVGRDDGKEGGEMNAVLVRRSAFAIESQKTLWLSETPGQVSRSWDAMFNRTMTVLGLKSRKSGKRMYFMDTHFDHVGHTARSESAKLIVQTLQTLDVGLPVILTGDLNDRPGFAGYQTLITHLQDAAVVARTPATGGDITFNGFGKDIQPGNKIDFVFVSSGQQVLSHQVITDLYDDRYPSDHYPIVVKVLLP